MARQLKVFRTAIGFHDAYVAAPSKKAALEVWGTETDLFSRGAAELVTDEALTKEPLAAPGKVIKRSRGSISEQLAALAPDKPKKRKHSADGASGEGALAQVKSGRPPAVKKKKPRPSRDSLDKAQRELEDLVARQGAEEQALRARERALQKERQSLDRIHERDRRAAEKTVEKEKETHSAALNRWIETGGE